MRGRGDIPVPAGTATSLGSLPQQDPLEAARFVLDLHPVLPAAPQLPHASPHEGMLAQWAHGIPGVGVEPDGRLTVPGRLDPEAEAAPALDHPGTAGLHAFLALAARRTRPIKLQLTGPVTLGLALARAGAPPEAALALAGGALRTKAVALAELARSRVRAAPLVVFLDEPGLVALNRADAPIDRDAAIDAISGVLAALEPYATTGLHCCGETDWRLALQAGPGILSLPVSAEVADHAGTLAAFLESGGWVAWGVVPTDGPVGTDGALCWRDLSTVWCELVRAGCDPTQLRAQALVTPACGLAGHDAGSAARVLDLTTRIGRRVRDQATAARFAMGA